MYPDDAIAWDNESARKDRQTNPGLEQELDTTTPEADILGKAYDFGHHNLLDGCLLPLLAELQTLITQREAKAYERGRRDAYTDIQQNASGGGSWRRIIIQRLARLEKGKPE